MIGRGKPFGAGQTRVNAVRLTMEGHDAKADARLDPREPLQPFLAAFEAAMDQTAAAAGLGPRWADLPQVQAWLAFSDPAWGQRERAAGHAHYPGATEATRGDRVGLATDRGPGAHKTLRDQIGLKDVGIPRWLPVPRRG